MPRPLTISLLGFVLLIGAAQAEPGEDRSVAIYPPQTIPLTFDHAFHLKAGADCLTCHDATRKSVTAGDLSLPRHAECEACHDLDKPSECGVCHPGFDPTAQRAPRQADWPVSNLHFNHKVHLDRKVACDVCHGNSSSVPLATRAQLPKMAVCLTCHDGTSASASCDTCHLTDPSGRLLQAFLSGPLRPMEGNPLGIDHGPRFEFNHGTRARTERATCNNCHADSYCQRCHDSLQKPLSVHPNDFITLHPVQARQHVTECDSCHRRQSFCAACHQLAGVGPGADLSLLTRTARVHPDPQTWTQKQHGVQASRDISQCISCHREETCIACHADTQITGLTGSHVNPHPAGFGSLCKSLAVQNERPCLKCHTPQYVSQQCLGGK